MRTIAEINYNNAVVMTGEEVKAKVVNVGITKVTKEVDVITTGTFKPMESSGGVINFVHTDVPIKILCCWLDGVPAYSGFRAVDL